MGNKILKYSPAGPTIENAIDVCLFHRMIIYNKFKLK